MTREERIEAALATVGKTTPEPWETFDRGDYSDCCGDSRVIIGNDMRVAIVEDDGSAETMANTDLISAASLLRDEVIALRAQVERQRAIINQAQKAMTEMSIALHGDRVHGSSQASQDALPAFSAALSQIESEEAEGCEDCDDGCGCTDGPCFDDDHKEAQT